MLFKKKIYNSADLKKVETFFNKIKNVSDDSILIPILDVMFQKVDNLDYLDEKDTDIVKIILDCTPLKVIKLKLANDNYAEIVIMTVKEFECGMGLVCEVFHNNIPYYFSLYDVTKFIKS